ncbi:MAG: hypothetical protein KDB16_14395, partial [Acidimicrobiales bacterium]|nr:hypothetical protein [Acidimicrobiales bacterium]
MGRESRRPRGLWSGRISCSLATAGDRRPAGVQRVDGPVGRRHSHRRGRLRFDQCRDDRPQRHLPDRPVHVCDNRRDPVGLSRHWPSPDLPDEVTSMSSAPRPTRIGVQIAPQHASYDELRAIVLQLEAMGVDVV